MKLTSPVGYLGVFAACAFCYLAASFQAPCAPTPPRNEFWISPVYNPSGGEGSFANPYDGSIQGGKFDYYMSNLPPNSIVHVLAGTYQTSGSRGFLVKSGQRILGSGMDLTVLQLAPGTPTSTQVIGNFWGSSIEVADLTCDANYTSPNPPTVTYHGIGLAGDHHTIRRVKVKNLAHGDNSNTEAWGITIIAGRYHNTIGTNSIGNIIENCTVNGFAGANCSAIAVFATPTNYISGTIRDNIIQNLRPRATGVTAAINLNNCYHVVVEGNYVEDAMAGVYDDNAGNTNVFVINNTFKNVFGGINVVATVQRNWHVTGNQIELTYHSGYVCGIGFDGTHGTPGFGNSGLTLVGNTIKAFDKVGPHLRAVEARGCTGLTLVNNSIDPRCDLDLSGASGTNLYNNVDLDGNYLSSFNQIQLPNSVVRATVTTPSYTATYADHYIGITRTSPVSILLPAAVGHSGKEFVVANETSDTRPITISSLKGTINGSPQLIINSPYGAKTLISDGTNWFAR
jgi:hypothetical protein